MARTPYRLVPAPAAGAVPRLPGHPATRRVSGPAGTAAHHRNQAAPTPTTVSGPSGLTRQAARPARRVSGLSGLTRQARQGRQPPEPPHRALYSSNNRRPIIIFWISAVPSPMSSIGASRYSRSISYSLEYP